MSDDKDDVVKKILTGMVEKALDPGPVMTDFEEFKDWQAYKELLMALARFKARCQTGGIRTGKQHCGFDITIDKVRLMWNVKP